MLGEVCCSANAVVITDRFDSDNSSSSQFTWGSKYGDVVESTKKRFVAEQHCFALFRPEGAKICISKMMYR